MNALPAGSGLSAVDLGRLILGGAQFGMSYGVTNACGQVPESEVRAILAHAHSARLRLVDTAAAYGTSQQVLGSALVDFPNIEIISKLPAFAGESIGAADIRELQSSVLRSLELLRRGKLDALLVHACLDLFKPGGLRLVEFLQGLRSSGIASRIGVSIYEADEIDRTLEIFTPDVVQMPVNLFDQRLIRSGHVENLRAAGVEIHGRSAFLQGVLLAEPGDLPKHFEHFSDAFAAYSDFITQNKLSRLAASLGFMLKQSGVDKVVVGVTSLQELDEILHVLKSQTALPAMDSLACSDLNLIDPRRWPVFPRVRMESH